MTRKFGDGRATRYSEVSRDDFLAEVVHEMTAGETPIRHSTGCDRDGFTISYFGSCSIPFAEFKADIGRTDRLPAVRYLVRELVRDDSND